MRDRVTTAAVEMAQKLVTGVDFVDVCTESFGEDDTETAEEIATEEDCIEVAAEEYNDRAPTCEEHNSDTRAVFVWNTNAVEYTPLFEDTNVFGELCESLYGGIASSGESCEFLFNNLHLRLYSFVRANSPRDFNNAAVVYSKQEHMKLYRFIRSDLTDIDFDDSEDSYIRNADACMANWHRPEDNLPVLFANSSACSAIWHDKVQNSDDEGGECDLDTQGPFYHA